MLMTALSNLIILILSIIVLVLVLVNNSVSLRRAIAGQKA